MLDDLADTDLDASDRYATASALQNALDHAVTIDDAIDYLWTANDYQLSARAAQTLQGIFASTPLVVMGDE
jgi:hypothetical protein